ncbi:hypothetical protein AKJ16_DCAP26504 [Drosera capensis]
MYILIHRDAVKAAAARWYRMDNEESILGLIHEDDGIEDVDDVKMLDVEDGEVFDEESSRIKHGENEAIQACGGQKTADGYRFRTVGGILWNILKTREPNAYKEIMKKGKEFEKQFRQSSIMQACGKN